MTSIPPLTACTAFAGDRRLSSGPLSEVALAVKAALDDGEARTVLVFDDHSGRPVELDLRGSAADIVARFSETRPQPAGSDEALLPTTDENGEEPGERRPRGRPRLGVTPREVTLLPRHWAWLATQPGGASVTLRRLVEEARRVDNGGRAQRRAAQEAAYRFMGAMAGDLPGFEEALRALFADDAVRFHQHIAAWPADIAAYADGLAFPAQR